MEDRETHPFLVLFTPLFTKHVLFTLILYYSLHMSFKHITLTIIIHACIFRLQLWRTCLHFIEAKCFSEEKKVCLCSRLHRGRRDLFLSETLMNHSHFWWGQTRKCLWCFQRSSKRWLLTQLSLHHSSFPYLNPTALWALRKGTLCSSAIAFLLTRHYRCQQSHKNARSLCLLSSLKSMAVGELMLA